MSESIYDLLNRHINVSRETFNKLTIYHDLLVKWQSKINLVGPNTLTDAWQRHFLDSIQLLKLIDDRSVTILDLGSGAGFPGMAMAICGASDIHLIESDAKKITFLKEVARVTGCHVSIHHQRIEQGLPAPSEIIVSRACSELANLLTLSSIYVSHETICLFHKGKNYSKELLDANEKWYFDHTIIPSVTDSQGVILKLANIRKRGYDSSKEGNQS